MIDDRFLAELRYIDAELTTAERMYDSASETEVWTVYQRIRSPIVKIVPFINVIPVWGARLAKALQFLIRLADTVCPAQADEAA